MRKKDELGRESLETPAETKRADAGLLGGLAPANAAVCRRMRVEPLAFIRNCLSKRIGILSCHLRMTGPVIFPKLADAWGHRVTP